MRPDLGQVKNVPAVFFGLFRRHELRVDGVGRVVAAFDRVPQVGQEMVRVGRLTARGFSLGYTLESSIGLDVNLGIIEGAILVQLEGVNTVTDCETYLLDELVGMARVTVHTSDGSGGTTVAEELHQLVEAFLVAGMVTVH